MDRAVALKLLAAPYSQNEAFRQQLYREAQMGPMFFYRALSPSYSVCCCSSSSGLDRPFGRELGVTPAPFTLAVQAFDAMDRGA
jgi:hypothetical protein